MNNIIQSDSQSPQLHTRDTNDCNDIDELRDWVRALQADYNNANELVSLNQKTLYRATETRKLLEEQSGLLKEQVSILKELLADCEKLLAANRPNTPIRSN